MIARITLLLVLLSITNLACHARYKVVFEFSVSNLDVEQPRDLLEERDVYEVTRNDNVCTLCEEYAARGLDYLANNKTQTDIIKALHLTCSQTHAFKHECKELVDNYVPIFFLKISSIQPEEVCSQVNLCEKVVDFGSQLRQDSCETCHRAMSEVLNKLQDPDTELDLIKLLLKACESVKNYEKQCKKLVFEYGPVILTNAEKFLEKNDVCTVLHACPAGHENVQAVADS